MTAVLRVWAGHDEALNSEDAMAAPLRDIERGADAIGELDEATIAVASSPARVAARGAARTRLEAR